MVLLLEIQKDHYKPSSDGTFRSCKEGKWTLGLAAGTDQEVYPCGQHCGGWVAKGRSRLSGRGMA